MKDGAAKRYGRRIVLAFRLGWAALRGKTTTIAVADLHGDTEFVGITK